MQIASRGMLPIGALFGGLMADSLGITPVLWISSTGFVLASFWLLPLRKARLESETDTRHTSISA